MRCYGNQWKYASIGSWSRPDPDLDQSEPSFYNVHVNTWGVKILLRYDGDMFLNVKMFKLTIFLVILFT